MIKKSGGKGLSHVIFVCMAILVGLTLIIAGVKLTATAKPVGGGAHTTKGQKVEKAIFASGCFWKPQFLFSQLPGVVKTQVGYCGGKVDSPDYKQVCTDTTGHAEAVLVEFDPAKITYKDLLAKFCTIHDPTTLNRQGPDVGSQYRSAIFYTNDEQKTEALAALEKAKKEAGGRKVVTEVVAAPTFWAAEDYHQDYFKKHGAVCH